MTTSARPTETRGAAAHRVSWPLRGVLGIALMLLAFLVPALINRSPIIYADTVGYFHSGEGALNALTRLAGPGPVADGVAAQDGRPAVAEAVVENDDGISTARSVFYGLVFVASYHAAGIWGMALLQVGVTIAVLWLALPHLARVRSGTAVGIVAATGLAGAAGFTDTLAPDLFAGLAVLAAAILLARYNALSAGERVAWFGVAVAGCLFHKSIVAIMVLMAAYGIVMLLWRREPLRGIVWLGGVLAVGVGAMVAVNIAVERVSGRPPTDPPFLLARMVGDGTARKYLAETCPTRRYELCAYDLPVGMTENEFLWGRTPPLAVFAPMTLNEKIRVNEEAPEIVSGVLKAYPVEQVLASAGNFARQLLLVGIREFGVSPGRYALDRSAMRPDLMSYAKDSAVARGTMPLDLISWSMTAAYLAGLAVLAMIAATRRWRDQISRPVWRAVEFIVAGAIANAAVCSMLGGVFDRYQGRVAWLIPFAALCLVAVIYRGRTTTTDRAAL